MTNVIQELSGEGITLDHAHVRARVEDWKSRISDLYGDLVIWLSAFRIDQSDSIEMNEEMMRAYGVSPARLPVLRAFDERGEVAKFIPRGLWIIGANGRIDLFAAKGQFVIIDRSEYLSSSKWEIAPSLHRLETKQFARESLLQTIQ